MFKASMRRRIIISIIVFDLVIGVVIGLAFGVILSGRHIQAPRVSAHTDKAPLATVTIPETQDIFEPFILPVQPNTVVTWQNNDTATHFFATAPTNLDQSDYLNPQPFALSVAAGKQVSFIFRRPGLYHYYETTLDTWNVPFQRVVPRQGLLNYPLAMDGIIWVQGSISGLASAAINSIPNGHDDFVSEFLAISLPGSISWHNFDADPHFVGQVSGWSAPINPTDIGLYRIAGTDDIPGGDTITVFFNTPGLYYYYCRNHDVVNSMTNRVQVLTKASEYPIPMEGFILVTGN